jgi:hypothetical protein
MESLLPALLGTDVEFFVSFGIFVLAMLVLAFLIVRWAIRHDRSGFSVWRQRQQAAAPTRTQMQSPPGPAAGEGDGPPTPGP